MNHPHRHIVLVLSFLLSTFAFSSAYAKPAFEAYEKFILGGTHAGFAIQRYSFDAKHKTVTSISYTYVATGNHKTIESLVAKSDLNFEPISYQYTALVDGKPIMIAARFVNKKMTAVKVEGGKKTKLTATVPPDGFLSTFLNYVLLKNGLSVGKAYKFDALAEEEGKFRTGTAQILSETKIAGVPAFKIKFHYKTDFISLLSNKGEPLGTRSDAQDADTEIATKDAATKGITFNESQIRKLFGNIPLGVDNQIYGPKK